MSRRIFLSYHLYFTWEPEFLVGKYGVLSIIEKRLSKKDDVTIKFILISILTSVLSLERESLSVWKALPPAMHLAASHTYFKSWHTWEGTQKMGIPFQKMEFIKKFVYLFLHV